PLQASIALDVAVGTAANPRSREVDVTVGHARNRMGVNLRIRGRRAARVDISPSAVVGEHAGLVGRLATVTAARVVVATSAAPAAALRLQHCRECGNRYSDDKSSSHVPYSSE